MTINARRIALQGIGYVAIAIASQGFLPLDQVVQPQPQVSAGGGGGQITKSEWLRRLQPEQAQPALVASVDPAALAKAARDAKRKRRQRAEEELIIHTYLG